MNNSKLTVFLGCLLLLLSACRDEVETTTSEPVRGVKTYLVTESPGITRRFFSSVLQPTSSTVLAFEIPGRLEQISLRIGQKVAKGDVLATLEQTSQITQLNNAIASVAQVRANLKDAESTLLRQTQLLGDGVVTPVSVETARANVESLNAQLEQSEAGVDAAKYDLERSKLIAPFNGVIDSINVEEYETVGAGLPIASLYSPETMEASFVVSSEVVKHLSLGTLVEVQLANEPKVKLSGVVTELGSRAPTVASFPVVIKLRESTPRLRAGLAVEIVLNLPLVKSQGYEIPIKAVILDERSNLTTFDNRTKIDVFVFDKESSSVVRRETISAGVSGNNLIIVEGLNPGDRVVSAGVSFLHDGQNVSLIK